MKPEKEAPPGTFWSWNRLYGAVIVYAIVVIGVLTALTRLLDFGQTP